MYDENGRKTFSSSEDEIMKVLGAANGVYLVMETHSGLDEKANYLGVMDADGSWLGDSINVTEMVESSIISDVFDMGEGKMGVYCRQSNSNILMVFDTESGAYFSINNVWNHDLQFRNGVMIFQHWDGGTGGGHMGTICCVTDDGTLTELATEGDLLSDGDNGFVTDENGLSFYDRSGQFQWSFDKYELVDTDTSDTDTSSVYVYGDFVFIRVY